MKENKNLEFKLEITKTFLKTVSAFANYDGGTIIFGVDNSGNVVGIKDTETKCLDIENMINDAIKPNPEYSLSITNSGKTISLEVKPGMYKPYLYNSKAYKRNDTSTIEVDTVELKRLIIEGQNLSFEELSSKNQNLTFNYLEKELKAKTKINDFNQDTLKTLSLYSEDVGYNNAAEILSDNSSFPGIDIAKFGETINIFKKRLISNEKSILESYYDAVEMYKDYYQYEEIEGIQRKVVETIPEVAFREAIANAIIHREWDINSNIRVSMFDDRIEIVSNGGLPHGVNVGDFLEGRVSILRNPILANVFHRLKIIEKFGTGIRRIKESYIDSKVKPTIGVSQTIIEIILPLLIEVPNISDDEIIIYNALSKNTKKSMSEIMASEKVLFSKSKVTELLKGMEEKGIVIKEGVGKATKYRIL